MNENKYWFALYTKPRHEFKAEEQFKKSGIISYLPTVERIKQWSDRKKKITEPVLRGYIFIYATETQRLDALEFDSIVRCLCEHGRPALIPEWQIENLRKMLEYRTDYFVREGLVSGTQVEIKDGPFKGVKGVIQSSKEGKTLAVSIDLLNRSVIAYLPKESVVRVLE